MKGIYRLSRELLSIFVLLTGVLCYNCFADQNYGEMAFRASADTAPQVALTFDDGPVSSLDAPAFGWTERERGPCHILFNWKESRGTGKAGGENLQRRAFDWKSYI